jgi:hypothetical protein
LNCLSSGRPVAQCDEQQDRQPQESIFTHNGLPS